MASVGLRKELECPICLGTYTDPVTLRCGHNFCRGCMDQTLNTQDGSRDYSCPICRAKFQERPALRRNITLHDVAEHFLSTQPDQEEITGIIYCSYCVHIPAPAVGSCLHCEASLCDEHLRFHSKEPEHVLTEPTTSLENRKCSAHKRMLEYYCTKDTACICVSCYKIGVHQGYQLESVDEASEKKKEALRNILQNLITKSEKTLEGVQSLEERRRKAQEKAAGEAERVTALFIDIRRRVDDLEKKVLSDISRREEKMSQSLSDVIQKLEIKKDELSRKMRDIEELCNMTDPLTVLQAPETSDSCDPEEEGGDEDTGGHDGGDVVLELISHLSHTLYDIIRGVHVTFYREGPTDILLDVNTADNNLLISDDLKTATWTGITQNRPETVERFRCNQVMSGRGFTSGRHYWDVKISSAKQWRVGMCYPSIDRRRRQSFIGDSNKSWCLCGGLTYNNQCSLIYDSKVIPLPHQISSDRFRICLDYEAGQLSFYDLCDPIRHLHTYTAAFSEPLHAVLCVCEGSIKISGGAAVRSRKRRRMQTSDVIA